MDLSRLRPFLLAILLLLPGCVANQYTLYVDALTDGQDYAHAGRTYFIAPSKAQPDDLIFQEFRRKLEVALPEVGLNITRRFSQATDIIWVSYSMKMITSTVRVNEPVYGRTGGITQSRSERHGNKTDKTTFSTATHGIVGYRGRDEKISKGLTVLTFFAVSKSPIRELWHLGVTHTGGSGDLRSELGLMLESCKGYLARTTPGIIRINVEESEDGVLQVREVKE